MRPVETMVEILVIDTPKEIEEALSPDDKAFLRITSEDGKVIMNLTLNICGMIGGIAEGTAKRLGYKW